MRILADECVGKRLIRRLREAGFDVVAIAEHSPGMPDDQVLELSVEMSRCLITEDYDFSDLVFRFKKRSVGVVVIASGLADLPGDETRDVIAKRLKQLEVKMIGNFTVLERDKTRQRQLPA